MSKKENRSVYVVIPMNILPMPVLLATKTNTKIKSQNRMIKTATNSYAAEPLFKKNSSI